MSKFTIIATHDFWQKSLTGEKPAFQDGTVHLGYYRFKTKNHQNGGDPVALWMEGESLVCMLGNRTVSDHLNVFDTKDEDKQRYTLADLFNWICTKPVSYEDYSAYMDTGNWPGLNQAVSDQIAAEAAGPGHNSGTPQSEIDQLRDQIDALSGEVTILLKKGAAKSQTEADAAADVAERLGKLYGKADKAREVEKAPYWQKCCDIQEKWKPILTAAEIYKKIKAVVITPFLLEEDRKRQIKLAAERAEAERLRKAAEDAAAAAQRALDEAAAEGATEIPADLVEAAARAEAVQAQAAEAEKKADKTASTTVNAGTRGRSTGLRAQAVYTITDRRLASGSLKDEPGFLAEIDEVILKFARQVIASGRTVDGVEADKERNAA